MSLHLESLCSDKFVVNFLKSLAQMDDRIALARKQRVQTRAGPRCDLLEAVALDLVGDEHVALFPGKLLQRRGELVEQNASRISSFRPGIR